MNRVPLVVFASIATTFLVGVAGSFPMHTALNFRTRVAADSSVLPAIGSGIALPILGLKEGWDTGRTISAGMSNPRVFPGPGHLFLDASQTPVGNGPYFAAVGDFNGDGKQDLAVANFWGISVSIMLGNGDGTFQAPVDYAVSDTPTSIAVADLNGDGKLDLAVTNCGGCMYHEGPTSSPVSVLLGNGDGTSRTHVDYPTGNSPISVVIGDFNRDGKPDLAVANLCGDSSFYCESDTKGTVSVLLGNGGGTFQPQTQYPTGESPESLAAGDFNDDGKLDLAVIDLAMGNGGVSILLGEGNGAFQSPVSYATESIPLGIAVGDFNDDGKEDLVTANPCGANPGGDCSISDPGSVSILLGNGDGTFQPHVDYVTGPSDVSVAVGDFNGDGKEDLAVANSLGNSVSVLKGNGDGTFGVHVEFGCGDGPYSIAVGDFNGDDKTDLVTAEYGGGTATVLLGNGDGAFATRVDYGAGFEASSVAIGDFNGDGNADLAIANKSSGTISILLGNGDGTFQTQRVYETGTAPVSIATADFNGDGKLDLVTANYKSDGTVSVLLGNGDGTFQSAVGYPAGGYPYFVAVGDFNRDGIADLVVVNNGQSNGNTVSILLGTGNGSFEPQVQYATGKQPTSVAIGDFNRDGKEDLAVANNGNEGGNTVSVLLGNGDGTFRPQVAYDTAGYGPSSIAARDLNGDGKTDLAVTDTCGSDPTCVTPVGDVSILLGNGNGTFGKATAYTVGWRPTSIVLADFDGAHLADLAVANSYSSTISLLLGNGDGTFRSQVPYATGYSSVSVAVGDFNHDGAPDLAVVNSIAATASVLLNASGTRMALGSAPNPSFLDDTVTFTATVTASVNGVAIPQGTVTFETEHDKVTVELVHGVAMSTQSRNVRFFAG